MLEWTVSGWIVSALVGFIAGIITERCIGKYERFKVIKHGAMKEIERLKVIDPDLREDTKVIVRISKKK